MAKMARRDYSPTGRIDNMLKDLETVQGSRAGPANRHARHLAHRRPAPHPGGGRPRRLGQRRVHAPVRSCRRSRAVSAVVVMGVSGSGKSTVGRALAAALDWRFRGRGFAAPAGEHRENVGGNCAGRRGSPAPSSRMLRMPSSPSGRAASLPPVRRSNAVIGICCGRGSERSLSCCRPSIATGLRQACRRPHHFMRRPCWTANWRLSKVRPPMSPPSWSTARRAPPSRSRRPWPPSWRCSRPRHSESFNAHIE